MNYNVVNRPKLPRNKYGEVEKSTGTSGTSYFSRSDTSAATPSETIDTFKGSTSSEDGLQGLVPAPKCNVNEPVGTLNDNVKFLKGSGAWVDIPISRYTNEMYDKSGVNLYGNLWVRDTLSTHSLNVTGAAHFWELVIDKVRSTGGNILVTPGSFHIDDITASGSLYYSYDPQYSPWSDNFIYDASGQHGLDGFDEIMQACNIENIYARRCWQRRQEDTTKIANEIAIGDMIRCKTFNYAEGEAYAVSNKDYWTFVINTGRENHYFDSELCDCNYIDIFDYFTVTGSDQHYTLGTVCTDEGIISTNASLAPSHGSSPYQYQTISEIVNGNVTTNIPENETNTSVYDTSTPYAITEFTFGYGDMTPGIGDDLIVLGHLWDGDRQDAILISAYDPLDTQVEAPAICQYKGIRSYDNLSMFRVNQLAANGNIFTGRFMAQNGGYLVDINERLNMFYTDIQTGLETVGIHLDGDHSTIKLVGSVEVRQNGDGTTDTLTVWDDSNNMRVKVSPDAIPAKSSMASSVSPTYKATFTTLTGNRVPDYSRVVEHHTWKEFIWSWNHHWQYYTDSNYFLFKTTTDIGTLGNNETITVTGLSANILSKAYFKGSTYVSNRGTQSISSIIVRLKKRGTPSDTIVDTKTLTNTATVVVNSESASINYSSTLWDNYAVSSGSYYLELEIQYNVYASITYDHEQDNFYYTFDYSLTASSQITKATPSITLIGRNGMVFNAQGANRWFYAGESGMEMRWGDALISLDNDSGLKMSGLTQSLTNGQISNSATFVDNHSATSSNNIIYLPDATEYGVGRTITVLGNDFTQIKPKSSTSQKIYKTKATSESDDSYPSQLSTAYDEINTISLSRTYSKTEEIDGTTYHHYYRTHNPIIRLVCTGTAWLLLTEIN